MPASPRPGSPRCSLGITGNNAQGSTTLAPVVRMLRLLDSARGWCPSTKPGQHMACGHSARAAGTVGGQIPSLMSF